MELADLPDGTVTFLFTDIEASTRLANDYRTTRDAQARHHVILKTAVERDHGVVFETVGDAVYAAFPRAVDALEAAVSAQLELRNTAWGDVNPIRVRMGIHTGDVERQGAHYFGLALVRCARVMAVGHGGQILVSQATTELLDGALPHGTTLRYLGRYRLKDLPRPERIAQVVHPNLPSDFAPLKTVDIPSNSVPVQNTQFVGRERELADLVRRLTQTNARLITLVGPAGTGKTRLAFEAARQIQSEFGDGVVCVSLASLGDPNLLSSAVAEALGIREAAGQSLSDSIKQALQNQHLLLVLDNFEHVIERAPDVSELINACPLIRVLVTTREVLHLLGEQVVNVPPMMVPDPTRDLTIQDLMNYDGVRLFVERAQAINSGFALTDQSASALAEICARLDGLPLAIELAAARSNSLSPQGLLERLKLGYQERQRLLSGVSLDRPARHRTLHAAMDWSYGLLEPRVQKLFARLGAFSAGFGLDAAQIVASIDARPSISIFDDIALLIDKSLLRQEDGTQAEPRYRMLDTIREYAQECLRPDELDGVNAAITSCLVDQAERAECELTGPDQVQWLDRLERENDNLRASLQWSLRAMPTQSLRLAGALWRFWSTRGYLGEGLRWLSSALAATEPERSALRAKVMNGAGNLARELGDYVRANELHRAGLDIWRELGDSRGVAEALNNLGLVALFLGKCCQGTPRPATRCRLAPSKLEFETCSWR